jgi:AraC family transcriptional regulator
MTATRVAAERPDGRRGSRVTVGSFEVTRLVFPPNYRHGDVEPQRGYLVVVLEGAVRKSFAGDATTLSRDSVATLPAGATHSSDFAPRGTQVLAVRPAQRASSALFGSLLTRRRHVRAAASTALGWRMAGELESGDASAGLALEGLVLQLLATATRASGDPPRAATGWLRILRDLVHDRARDRPSLTELAASVGHHPTHVARAFRHEYGVTIAQYARSVRLEWARTQLILDDAPLAQLAIDSGFADQSHFTRAFKRHTGVTPGRYRELGRR